MRTQRIATLIASMAAMLFAGWALGPISEEMAMFAMGVVLAVGLVVWGEFADA